MDLRNIDGLILNIFQTFCEPFSLGGELELSDFSRLDS